VKIGVLTSSRADYGIYWPLLKKLQDDSIFESEVIAFGSHLNKLYGNTIDLIYEDGFNVKEVPISIEIGETPEDISILMAATMNSFATFFARNKYDLIFALGDRYEMFAAVAASAPFNVPIAHIHGGETTLGAIDNAFRHSITCFANLHFTCSDIYKNRVEQIVGDDKNVYNVGALSIENIKTQKLLGIDEFMETFKIDLTIPTILFTFHPETVAFEKNNEHIAQIINAFKGLTKYQILVTMPNADTMGLMIRKELENTKLIFPNIFLVETLGSRGYLSAMKYCSFMLGNSSSGFVEASFFAKPVINLGDRQKGRIATNNIITIPITTKSIIKAVKEVESRTQNEVTQLYGTGNTSSLIMEIIMKNYTKLLD
jgi:GDP/UDP-N,N'-diacetylbacillosamine 2-epimerase (hydrolysing)